MNTTRAQTNKLTTIAISTDNKAIAAAVFLNLADIHLNIGRVLQTTYPVGSVGSRESGVGRLARHKVAKRH